MTASTQTLADFLLARIAEDEAAARRALGVTEAAIATPGTPRIHRAAAEKTDLPARRRVLAECEAKRQIIELHKPSGEGFGVNGELDACVLCQWDVDCDSPRHGHQYPDGEGHARWWPCETLRLLALPYADHPDFCKEWRA